MTTAAPTELETVLLAAATAAAAALAGAEPLTPGPATRDAESAAPGSSAVLASFTGGASGDLLLAVDDATSAALRDSSIGELDLAAALAPVVQAVAAAIGPVVLGPLQQVDTRLGLGRVLAGDDAAVVPLLGPTGPRACLALSLLVPAAVPAPLPSVAPSDAVQAQRLDLLRGVEMEATAELGRARMTINDLLALRSGAVIELDRPAGAPADLYVNGRLIARAEVVVVDENYGLRITQIVTDAASR